MTARVLIGKRGSEYGLWVSKAGCDVNTCSEDDMMLSMGITVFQARHTIKGVPGQPATSGVNTDTQAIDDEGYRPMIMYLPYMAGEERLVDPPYVIGAPDGIIGGWTICPYGSYTECSVTVETDELTFSNARRSSGYTWQGAEGDRIACKVLGMEAPS